MADDLCRISAVALRERIARRECSIPEAVEAAIESVEARNPALNAFCTTAFDLARTTATAAQARLDAGEPARLLEGVPVAIKDVTDTAGLRTTYGSRLFADHVPLQDALVVQRLKAAGAIVLGKTNTSEFAAGAHATNALFGPTRNPWNLKLTAGGSTGGGAAAVAAGLAPLAEGTDMGGSLRIPASFCGVVGLRPTVGLIPTLPNAAPWDVIRTHGPIARTAEDAALMLQVLAGHDPNSPIADTANHLIHRDFQALRGRPWRIGYVDSLSGIEPDTDLVKTSHTALEQLSASGITVEPVSLSLADGRDAFLALRGLFMVQQHLDKLERLDEVGPNLRNNIEAGRKVTTPDLARAEHKRAELFQRLRTFFDQFDALLTLCMPVEPFPVEQNYPAEINGKQMATYIDWVAQTFLVTLAGVPAAAVPCGISAQGLPVGWQVVGPRFADSSVLAFCAHVQETLPLPAPPRLP